MGILGIGMVDIGQMDIGKEAHNTVRVIRCSRSPGEQKKLKRLVLLFKRRDKIVF